MWVMNQRYKDGTFINLGEALHLHETTGITLQEARAKVYFEKYGRPEPIKTIPTMSERKDQ